MSLESNVMKIYLTKLKKFTSSKQQTSCVMINFSLNTKCINTFTYVSQNLIPSNFSITKELELKELLKLAKIFIWHKAQIINKAIFEVEDKLLCNITNIDQLFGKKSCKKFLVKR